MHRNLMSLKHLLHLLRFGHLPQHKLRRAFSIVGFEMRKKRVLPEVLKVNTQELLRMRHQTQRHRQIRQHLHTRNLPLGKYQPLSRYGVGVQRVWIVHNERCVMHQPSKSEAVTEVTKAGKAAAIMKKAAKGEDTIIKVMRAVKEATTMTGVEQEVVGKARAAAEEAVETKTVGEATGKIKAVTEQRLWGAECWLHANQPAGLSQMKLSSSD